MTADRLTGAVLILRPMSSDDDAVLDAIREEMRCAEVYRDAKCAGRWAPSTVAIWRNAYGVDPQPQCEGMLHVASCPVAVAEAAWVTATDARRKL